jgi:hypothetical protein
MVAVVAVVVLWKVGESHKRSCVREGRVNCSVLPWSGDLPGTGASGGSNQGLIQGVGSSVHGVGAGVSGSYGRSGQSIP